MSAKPTARPVGATTVDTYERLHAFIQAFAANKCPFLLLIGDPGVGKTQAVAAALGDRPYYFRGAPTPYHLYTKAHEHRDRPLVLDDPDGLFRDRATVNLLKHLCDSVPVKTVGWTSRAAVRDGLPESFQTRSPVLLIANQWSTLSDDVRAVQDRGITVVFEPSAVEVHRQAATYFWCQEVFDFVAAHLAYITRPSLREYERAWWQRGMNPGGWREDALGWWLTEKPAWVAARVLADPNLVTNAQREQEFERLGGGRRATFYRRKKQLEKAREALAAAGGVPAITLDPTNRPPDPTPVLPPAPPPPDDDLMGQILAGRGLSGGSPSAN